MAEPTAAQRRSMAKTGQAMPDGSYYIRNRGDLQNAIDAVGRGNAPHDAIRRHIIARAKALGCSDMIPDNWTASGARSGSARQKMARGGAGGSASGY